MSSTDPQRPGDHPVDPDGTPQPGGQEPYGAAPGDRSSGAPLDPWAAPPESGGSAGPAVQDPWAAPPAEPSWHPAPVDPYGGGVPSAGSASQGGAPHGGADPYGGGDPYGAGAPSGGAPYGGMPYGAAPQGGAGPAPVHGAPGQIGTSRLLAGLMGIFLGGFGVHRFLLGYTAIGVVQILVTIMTCGAGHLWGLIEGIMILAKAEPFTRDAQGRPLTD